MVSSGIRRDIWKKRGFNTALQFAEDDEYTRWCVSQGYLVKLIENSVVMHSHNYTPSQAYRRSYGDAKSMASVGSYTTRHNNSLRTLWMGWLSDMRLDLSLLLHSRKPGELVHAGLIRWHQRKGKLDGIRDGLKNGKNSYSSKP